MLKIAKKPAKMAGFWQFSEGGCLSLAFRGEVIHPHNPPPTHQCSRGKVSNNFWRWQGADNKPRTSRISRWVIWLSGLWNEDTTVFGLWGGGLSCRLHGIVSCLLVGPILLVLRSC